MTIVPYCPCHLHTTFSLLDSVIKIPELMTRLKELNITSCAITDHGNLHGIIDFYKECKKNEIKPILGMEAYLTEDSDNSEEKRRDNYHMVLLAKNETGYKNLIWLSSNAYQNNFYYRPRISYQKLIEHSEGLIGLSGCLAGYPAKMARFEQSINKVFVDNYKNYVHILKEFQEAFRGDYYLEIQDHDFWEQVEYNKMLISVARKEKFPLVMTSDAHYLRQTDHSLHEMMIAMQLKQTIDQYKEGDQLKYSNTNYIREPEKMLASTKTFCAEEAYYNTIKIMEACDLQIEFDKLKMPVFPVKEADDYQEFLEYKKNGTLLLDV